MSEMRSVNDARPRPAIGLLLSAAGILIAATVAGIAAIGLPVTFRLLPGRLTLLFWFSLLMLPLLLGFYTTLTHSLEGRPLASVGFAFHPRWKNELATGLIAGAVMILAIAGAESLLGVARFSLAPGPAAKTVLAGTLLFLMLLAAAADEELVFRGYPFQRLVEVAGPVFAVVAVSALFGAAHLRNPFQNWISTLNTALVGVLLAICYLRTRALWLPLGIHFAWNFIQGYVLGLPVSGLAFPHGIFQAKISGPFWLTGGAYGPEGSILCLGVIAAGTAYFFVSKRIYTTSEMRHLGLGRRNEKATGLPLFPSDGVPAGKR
ncbi:MAG TPA: type II CAAX endopeptidase family protein [Terriglobia bacterium]|nr:type II CAAX endopeptidase family protein [Terriglobia bacterium]